MKINILGLSSPARYPLDQLEAGLATHEEIWRQYGFQPSIYPSCFVQNHYETLSPQAKVLELQELACKDKQIIVSLRGGYSTNFMLDKIDFNLLKTKHNTIIGHSDLTILLNQLALKTNWHVYHGPLFTSVKVDDQYTLKHLKAILSGESKEFKSVTELEIINPQAINGKIIGGNLSLITMAIGTKYELDLRDKIVLLEDVSEPDFKIDGMLWQLANHYDLREVRGFIIGSFVNCTWEYSEKQRGVRAILNYYLAGYQKPIWFNFSSSHDPIMTCLPLNRQVEISLEGKVRLLGK